MGCPRGANEERPAGLSASRPARSQTERASCFHRSGNDLSSEVPESHAPADRRLLTHKERHECRPSGGEREEAAGLVLASAETHIRAERCILTLNSAALKHLLNRSNYGRQLLRFPRASCTFLPLWQTASAAEMLDLRGIIWRTWGAKTKCWLRRVKRSPFEGCVYFQPERLHTGFGEE